MKTKTYAKIIKTVDARNRFKSGHFAIAIFGFIFFIGQKDFAQDHLGFLNKEKFFSAKLPYIKIGSVLVLIPSFLVRRV